MVIVGVIVIAYASKMLLAINVILIIPYHQQFSNISQSMK